MSINEKKVIDLKVIEKKKETPVFSSGLYHWMMFLINFYNRVKKDLKIDFDSFMILQLVVSDNLYKFNKDGTKNFKELEDTFKDYESLLNDKRTINIASISEILNLPRETVRRKILHLTKFKLLNYNKNGITIGSDYQTVFAKFVPETVSNMSKLVKRWEDEGSLKRLLELNKQ